MKFHKETDAKQNSNDRNSHNIFEKKFNHKNSAYVKKTASFFR